MKITTNKIILVLGVAILVYCLDMASKVLVREHISLYEQIAIIPGFFNLVHAENDGIAFGMFSGSDFAHKDLILTLTTLAGIALIIALIIHTPGSHRLELFSLSLILAGALGNLSDRLFRGSVTDFLDVYLGRYHWPSFNIADSAVTIGAILLGWSIMFISPRKQRTTS